MLEALMHARTHTRTNTYAHGTHTYTHPHTHMHAYIMLQSSETGTVLKHNFGMCAACVQQT